MHTQKRRPHRPHASHPPKTSWERVSRWYGAHLEKEGTYQEQVVYPGTKRLLAARDGERVLDIACGEGAFDRLLLKDARIELTGFDGAPSLVRQARQKAPRGAEYFEADAADFLKRLPRHGYDAAVCILALQNIEPYEAVIRQAAAALKDGARFIFVLNHPCFRQPRQSGWGWDEGRKLQYRRVDAYLSAYDAPIQAHPGAAPGVVTHSYHRPLHAYVGALAKYGFAVEALEEWTSHRTSDPGPKAKAENVARREIPLFLAIRARK